MALVNELDSDLTDGRLKIRHLKLVVAIAREGTLGAAGDELDISQPVVSRTLQEVESIVGARLFERGRGGVRPTPAGVHFLRHAQGVLTQLALASRELLDVASGRIGRVVIGTGVAGIDPLLPLAVDTFHDASPSVIVAIHEAPPAELLSALLDGSVDLVIGRSVPSYLDEQLTVRPLYTERLVPTVAIDHELAEAKDLTLGDLSGFRWVIPDDRTAARADFTQAFFNTGASLPTLRVECSSIHTATELVRFAGYISPLPETLASRDSRLQILDIELPNMTLPICLIQRAFGEPTDVAEAFVAHLEAARDALGAQVAAD